MQTFLPFPDFAQSASVLDRQRLGKQRVETIQILKALTNPSYGWQNHPAIRMWRGHVPALTLYGLAICHEWTRRGYTDNCAPQIASFMPDGEILTPNPPWFGDPAFHASHRSNLLRKDPAHYGQFHWTDSPDLPYIWPEP